MNLSPKDSINSPTIRIDKLIVIKRQKDTADMNLAKSDSKNAKFDVSGSSYENWGQKQKKIHAWSSRERDEKGPFGIPNIAKLRINQTNERFELLQDKSAVLSYDSAVGIQKGQNKLDTRDLARLLKVQRNGTAQDTQVRKKTGRQSLVVGLIPPSKTGTKHNFSGAPKNFIMAKSSEEDASFLHSSDLVHTKNNRTDHIVFFNKSSWDENQSHSQAAQIHHDYCIEEIQEKKSNSSSSAKIKPRQVDSADLTRSSMSVASRFADSSKSSNSELCENELRFQYPQRVCTETFARDLPSNTCRNPNNMSQSSLLDGQNIWQSQSPQKNLNIHTSQNEGVRKNRRNSSNEGLFTKYMKNAPPSNKETGLRTTYELA